MSSLVHKTGKTPGVNLFICLRTMVVDKHRQYKTKHKQMKITSCTLDNITALYPTPAINLALRTKLRTQEKEGEKIDWNYLNITKIIVVLYGEKINRPG